MESARRATLKDRNRQQTVRKREPERPLLLFQLLRRQNEFARDEEGGKTLAHAFVTLFSPLCFRVLVCHFQMICHVPSVDIQQVAHKVPSSKTNSHFAFPSSALVVTKLKTPPSSTPKKKGDGQPSGPSEWSTVIHEGQFRITISIYPRRILIHFVSLLLNWNSIADTAGVISKDQSKEGVRLVEAAMFFAYLSRCIASLLLFLVLILVQPPPFAFEDSKYMVDPQFAPVLEEITTVVYDVSTNVPAHLVGGVFLRNGPNPIARDMSPYHWFDGDGFIFHVSFAQHSLTLQSRWTKTPTLTVRNNTKRPKSFLAELQVNVN
jgi:hypothetical protein